MGTSWDERAALDDIDLVLRYQAQEARALAAVVRRSGSSDEAIAAIRTRLHALSIQLAGLDRTFMPKGRTRRLALVPLSERPKVT